MQRMHRYPTMSTFISEPSNGRRLNSYKTPVVVPFCHSQVYVVYDDISGNRYIEGHEIAPFIQCSNFRLSETRDLMAPYGIMVSITASHICAKVAQDSHYG